MILAEVMQQLEALGNSTTKNTLLKHGAREPFFGVKVGDLKPLQKKIKKNYDLSKALYSTGNSDAMYLAGLIADEKAITKEDLQEWVQQAYWYYLSEYTVAQVAAESAYGWELALQWIESQEERIASAGWATIIHLLSIKPDEELDMPHLQLLLSRVADTLQQQPNRVRYTMNGFVIASATFVPQLAEQAKAVARQVGKVQVDMGGTACKVPEALAYIEKAAQRPRRKKKTARC
ncbi:DNA alkylation repair protein [Pontibacter anaerobius]|uniref:DNA alkylation repair protein n=1 Tax=Pontibacter anaerobius TaxID=2993940 RepID=A0ABT3RH89_9BACT|nr:DNA alkylation repair protein [Pontibacter anaerobius]MCX2740811.1 DNA alkylation repair protein [Pontibacter anaerobius]